jgi:very-short-patch-repair endonuclease
MRYERDKSAIATTPARSNAGKLRKMLTEPEKRLWTLLRRHLPKEGTHFRRQMAIGRYVVDFICLGARLVIEVDGDQHGEERALRYDAERSTWLESQGLRVLRFTNRQVMKESEMVIDTIYAALTGESELCSTPPTPIPSPRGGGEEPC